MECVTLCKEFVCENGAKLSRFDLDFDALSTADLKMISKLEALSVDTLAGVQNSGKISLKYLSFPFQIASAFVAAMKGTPGLTVSDYTRIPMRDAMNMAQAAYFFWLESASSV